MAITLTIDPTAGARGSATPIAMFGVGDNAVYPIGTHPRIAAIEAINSLGVSENPDPIRGSWGGQRYELQPSLLDVVKSLKPLGGKALHRMGTSWNAVCVAGINGVDGLRGFPGGYWRTINPGSAGWEGAWFDRNFVGDYGLDLDGVM